jgi:hypothetical protein
LSLQLIPADLSSPPRRQSVFIQTRELEELQERIRVAEARLGRSDSSNSNSATALPTRRPTVSQRGPSIFAIAETVKEEEVQQTQVAGTRVPGTQTPQSTTSNEYVVVRRPRPVGGRKYPRVDSHVESETSEEEEEEDSEDASSEEDEKTKDSEAASSEEEEEEEESSEEED